MGIVGAIEAAHNEFLKHKEVQDSKTIREVSLIIILI